MKYSINIWVSVLWVASLGACSSPVLTPATVGDGGQFAGYSCPSGREPIYGWTFDSPATCVDFGTQANRVQIACLPVERPMSGLVTCYVRSDRSAHVMTPWLYEGLQSQGWEVCPPNEVARRDCDGASSFDGGSMPDAMSHTDAVPSEESACRPNGTYQRSCSCADASLAVVPACGPGAEGPCWMYTSSCVDPGFVICEESAFALDATLRARCEQFCTTVRASDPASGCRF